MSIILKKLGSPIMTNLYYGTIKSLLERISSVMIDREAIQHLVGLVKEAVKNGDILSEMELSAPVAVERGLRLLLVLAFVHPSHFLYTVSIFHFTLLEKLGGIWKLEKYLYPRFYNLRKYGFLRRI